MKRFILYVLLGSTLIACSNGKNTNSQNSESVPPVSLSNSNNSYPSNHISTDTDTSHNSENIEQTIPEQLMSFYNQLSSLEGKVKSTEQTIHSIRYYLTNSEPLTLGMKEVSTTNRYIDQNGEQIVVQKGYVGIADKITDTVSNPDYFETQTFHDDSKFYQITDYESELSTDNKNVLDYNSSYEEQNLNIGFPMSEKLNIDFMVENYDNPIYKISFDNIDDIISNGIWEYSYELTIFETNGTAVTSIPYQIVGYHNKLTIKDNIIVSVEQDYYNELYTGGIKANWVETKMIKTYIQGEFDTFTGTRFNPDDYK